MIKSEPKADEVEVKEKDSSPKCAPEPKKDLYFYQVTPEQLTELQKKKEAFLMLECQPYGGERYYRIATMQAFQKLTPFEDTGRTNGWFQNLLASGIYRTTGKVKLSDVVQAFSATVKSAEVSDGDKKWADIILTSSNQVRKANLKE